MDTASLICRFALGTIFVLAGIAKLPRKDEFEAAVRSYRLLPAAWVARVAAALPVFELASGGFLLLGFLQRVDGLALGACLVVFAAAVSVNLARGREIDCGCFGGVAEKQITWWTVSRNVVLIGVATLVAAHPVRALSLDQLLHYGQGRRLPASYGIGPMIAGTLLVVAVSVAREALAIFELRAAAEGQT